MADSCLERQEQLVWNGRGPSSRSHISIRMLHNNLLFFVDPPVETPGIKARPCSFHAMRSEKSHKHKTKQLEMDRREVSAYRKLTLQSIFRGTELQRLILQNMFSLMTY